VKPFQAGSRRLARTRHPGCRSRRSTTDSIAVGTVHNSQSGRVGHRSEPRHKQPMLPN